MSVFDLCAHVWVSAGRFMALRLLQCVKGQEKGNYQQASKTEQMPVQINPNQLNVGFSARFFLISQGMQEKCGEYMRIPEVGTKERPWWSLINDRMMQHDATFATNLLILSHSYVEHDGFLLGCAPLWMVSTEKPWRWFRWSTTLRPQGPLWRHCKACHRVPGSAGSPVNVNWCHFRSHQRS